MLLSPLPEQEKKNISCNANGKREHGPHCLKNYQHSAFPGRLLPARLRYRFRAQAEKMQLALPFEDDPKALMHVSGVFPVSLH